jgi:hydrogenase-1 operon protein HyaF
MTTSNTVFSQFNIQAENQLTWNVMPLLHQIRHALQNLLDNNISEVIDLRSIPLAPGEEDRLLQVLGTGEVQVKLNALGPSDIIETRFNGVWLVTHYNDENEIISRHIEITRMPDILLSQTHDMSDALQQLSDLLDEQNEQPAQTTDAIPTGTPV